MLVTIIINNFYGADFDTSEMNDSKIIETSGKIDSFEIKLSEASLNTLKPQLYLDPRNSKQQIRLPLKKKYGPDPFHFSLDKKELMEYPDFESNRYKYIFNPQDSHYPEGYLFFKIVVGEYSFVLTLHFQFKLIDEIQFKRILIDIKRRGSNFFLNPENLLPEKFNIDESINLTNNVGGRKYLLLLNLFDGIKKYINEDFDLTLEYDELIDEDLIVFEASRYQNKFVKFILVQILMISQDIIKELSAELNEYSEYRNTKISRGLKSPLYIENLDSHILEYEIKKNVLKKSREEIKYYLELTIIRNIEFIPNILQYVGMIVKKNPFFLNILHNYLMLFYSMQYDLDEKSTFISYQKIPEIYEHWAYFKVCECIEEIGFKFINTNKNYFSFSKKLIPDTTNHYELINAYGHKVQMNVIYNRYYEVASKEQGVDYGFANSRYKKKGKIKELSREINFINKRNPDISIEIFINENKIPKILIFDATYSENNEYSRENIFPAKMAYSFYFIDKDENNIGIASWVLLPDKSIKLNSDIGDYITISNHQNGALVLNPGDDSSKQALMEIIKDRLNAIGLLI